MELLELLYAALRAELGVRVPTPEPERLRQRLYAERRKAEDPALDVLSFIPDPRGVAELWLVKTRKPNGKEI